MKPLMKQDNHSFMLAKSYSQLLSIYSLFTTSGGIDSILRSTAIKALFLQTKMAILLVLLQRRFFNERNMLSLLGEDFIANLITLIDYLITNCLQWPRSQYNANPSQI